MTPQQWHSNQGRRESFAAFINSPTFLDAVAMTLEAMEPTATEVTRANPHVGSALHHESAGAHKFLRLLRSLAQEPMVRKTPKPEQLRPLPTVDDD